MPLATECRDASTFTATRTKGPALIQPLAKVAVKPKQVMPGMHTGATV